jgi:hypothetical protein
MLNKVLIASLLLLLPVVASAFSIPERLEFGLYWSGIKAGNAVMETKDDGSTIQIVSTTTSTPLVSVFYKVEDVITSTIQKSDKSPLGASRNYRVKIREGSHRRDKEVIFDSAAKRVTYINHIDKNSASYDLTEATFDPLASLYYVRTLPLEMGKSVYVSIFDSGKFYKLEVKVIKREEVETPAGTFKTIMVQPVMLTEGIFSRKGDIYVWFTDDEKRIPVQLKTKVKVGSVTGQLTGGKY